MYKMVVRGESIYICLRLRRELIYEFHHSSDLREHLCGWCHVIDCIYTVYDYFVSSQ